MTMNTARPPVRHPAWRLFSARFTRCALLALALLTTGAAAGEGAQADAQAGTQPEAQTDAQASAYTSAQENAIPPRQKWSFSGIRGQYDKAQLRRGLQIYEQKCRACHGMEHLDFRALTRPSGPELSLTEAREIAAGYEFPSVGDDGEPTRRPGRLSDRFVSPYASPELARYLNQGVAPPDLTYITLARSYDRSFAQFIRDFFTPYAEQGSDAVYAILTGYDDDDPQMTANRYAPGGRLSMVKPLFAGEFEYPKTADGQPVAPQTEEQYAKDVTAFLTWVADPDRAARQRMGWCVLAYLAGFLGLLLLGMYWRRRTDSSGYSGK